jgi:hypothetical protein
MGGSKGLEKQRLFDFAENHHIGVAAVIITTM